MSSRNELGSSRKFVPVSRSASFDNLPEPPTSPFPDARSALRRSNSLLAANLVTIRIGPRATSAVAPAPIADSGLPSVHAAYLPGPNVVAESEPAHVRAADVAPVDVRVQHQAAVQRINALRANADLAKARQHLLDAVTQGALCHNRLGSRKY
jgi:hypothetical protein